MLGRDVIGQLWANLPRHSDNFTFNVGIVSVSRVGTTVTVETDAAHGITVDRVVNIQGVFVPVEIDTVTDNGATWTLATLSDHDLTKNAKENIDVLARITGGIDETFTVTSVANRRTFNVGKGTGTPIAGDFLQESFLSGYNGLQTVTTVPDTTTFTYEVTEALADPNLSEGTVSGKHRISGAVSFDVANAAYTKQGKGNYWIFVVMDDTDPNKDRRGTNDATSQRGGKQAFFHQVVERFTLYLFVPNKGESLQDVGGLISRDEAIDERLPILRSVLGIEFPASLTFQGQGKATYNGDGTFLYEGSYYVHAFNFEQVASITNSDTAIEADSRAFRDINFAIDSLGIQDTDTDMTADVDLDDEPIE